MLGHNFIEWMAFAGLSVITFVGVSVLMYILVTVLDWIPPLNSQKLEEDFF